MFKLDFISEKATLRALFVINVLRLADKGAFLPLAWWL